MSPARYSPLYHWLSQTLREEIAHGVYEPGDALPTEHALMRRYDLSITTVRRAVHDLAREGLVYRRAGKGTFVRRTKLEEHLLRLTSFAEEMQSRNIKPQFKLLKAEMKVPSQEIAQALKLPCDQKTFYIERVQMADREPIALARGYWLAEIGEKLATQDLRKIPLYEILESVFHIPLSEAVESISARVAPAGIARQIDARVRAPLLVRQRLTLTRDMRPIEHTTTYYRADRYDYKIRLARHGV